MVMIHQQAHEDDPTESRASVSKVTSKRVAPPAHDGGRESAQSEISAEADSCTDGMVVVESWFDRNRSGKDRQDRLAADQSLIQYLSNKGYRGREYELFCEEIARYALSVMAGWLVTGHIFLLCKKHDRSVGTTIEEINKERRQDLAFDTAAAALRSFRSKMLRGDGWR